MTRIKFSVAIFLTALPAGAQIQQPQLGYMLDTGGMLRPVFGLAASANLGDPEVAGAISFACTSTRCLAKTDAAVVSLARPAPGNVRGSVVSSAIPTPCDCPGPALIAVDPLTVDPATEGGAWIYFQAGGQLARWQNGAVRMIDFAPGGEVLSLRATADGFDYAISREAFGRKTVGLDDGRETRQGRAARAKNVVWIEHYSAKTGSVAVLDSVILDSLEGVGHVMLLDGGILLSSDDQLMLQRSNGEELTFPLQGANAFQAAEEGYVEIAAPGGIWVLRTDPGSEQLSLLPGVPQ